MFYKNTEMWSGASLLHQLAQFQTTLVPTESHNLWITSQANLGIIRRWLDGKIYPIWDDNTWKYREIPANEVAFHQRRHLECGWATTVCPSNKSWHIQYIGDNRMQEEYSSAIHTLELLEALGNERNAKIERLQRQSNNSILKAMFLWAYRWDVRFWTSTSYTVEDLGEASSKRCGYCKWFLDCVPKFQVSVGTPAKDCVTSGDWLPSTKGNWQLDHWYEWDGILTQLNARTLTGNAANDRVQGFLQSLFAEFTIEYKWFSRILNRDLRVGLNGTTLAKIWPEFVSSFGVQGALSLEDYGQELHFPLLAEPKMDGYRFHCLPEGKILQRSGADYTPLLGHFNELAAIIPCILDFEWLADWDVDNPEDARWDSPWNKTATFAREGMTAGGWKAEDVQAMDPNWLNRVRTESRMWLFDCLNPDTYQNGLDATSQWMRRYKLVNSFMLILSTFAESHATQAQMDEIQALIGKVHVAWGSINQAIEAINSKGQNDIFDSGQQLAFLEQAESDRKRAYVELNGAESKLNDMARQIGLPIVLTPQWVIWSREEMEQLYESVLGLGFEGVILKDPISGYIPNEDRRDGRWLKYKPVSTFEATIVGFKEGTGANKGRLGSFKVRLPNGTITFTSGHLKKQDRIDYWEDRENLLGMQVELGYQDDPNKVTKKARFPSFYRIRRELPKQTV